MAPHPSKFNPGWIPTLVTLALLVVLIGLGTWQLRREAEKRLQVSAHTLASEDVVLNIDSRLTSAEPFLQRRVEVAGHYDSTRQFLLDNRTHEGVAGYEVLTPIVLGGGGAILVNRGWVPVGASRDVLPDIGVSTEPLSVSGRLASAPRVVLLGTDGYDSGDWPKVVQTVDYARMSGLIDQPLLDGLIRLDPQAPQGYLRDWRPFFGISPERHRAYAVQWFSLAVTLVVLFIFFGLSRRGPK